jgi:hypothetical protein
MDNVDFNYNSNQIEQEQNIIIFIEEIILNIANEKNPILIIKRTDYNIISKKKNKRKEKKRN